MSVVKQINLKWIKYYGLRDISTNWIVTDFQKNRDFILQKVNDYQSYYNLLIEDFIFGFYLLNLFLLENDIKHNNSNYSWNLQIKNQYIDDINNIFKSLKLKEVNSVTEIFRDYILNNIKLIISDDFKKQLLEHSASYSSILNIFLNHLLTNSSFFNTEEEVKTLILLIDKIPYFYPKFLKSNIKHKNLIVENFKKFIENKIKNQENLIPNMDLLDTYLNLIQNKKGEEGKQNIKLQEEITCYCKKQIDQIDDAFYKISSAENFINLVNKYGLKFRCTTNLSLWYKNLREQLFNSNQGNKSKFSYKLFNNEEEWEKYNEYINKTKDDIKNTGRKTWFYDSENQTAFSYKSETKNPWRDLFNNSTGTYGKSSQDIELNQSIKFQLFLSLFNDEEIFTIYTDNFKDILESVLYDLGVAEKERNFFITRYYEIIDQLSEERQNKEIQSPFVYWKKIALLLSAIENFIKIFIEKIEMENSDDIKDINQSFSRYLGTMDYSNIKDGPIFKPSKYLNFFLSDNAKVILNYYLFAKYHASGLEIRNPTIHGSYISEEFLDQYYFLKINLLFFQLVEELTMNYVWSTLEKVNLNEFFRNFTLHNFKDKRIKISDFIKFNEERLHTYFQEYTRKKELNISDYAICFKLKYDENEKRFQLEIEGFKTFIYKVWI